MHHDDDFASFSDLLRDGAPVAAAADDVTARLLARADAHVAAVPMSPSPSPSSSPSLGRWGRVGLVGAAGIAVIGGAFFASTTPSSPAPVAVVAPGVIAAVAVPVEPATPADVIDTVERGDVVVSDVEPASAKPSPPKPARVDIDEVTVLDQARTALAQGDPTTALRRLQLHQRQFRDGVLSEERDALTVVALVRSGRSTPAREAAARFTKRHPSSALTAVVREAVASLD